MTKYNYSVQIGNDAAKAVGRALPISHKVSIEICTMVRGKPVDTALDMLDQVVALKKPVPYKRAYKDIGHRKGNLTSGRFPQKAAGFVKEIIASAKSNAEDKGLNTKELAISHISAQPGGNQLRGARRRRRAKRTHIEVVVKEDKELFKKLQNKKSAKPAKKKATKVEKKESKQKAAPAPKSEPQSPASNVEEKKVEKQPEAKPVKQKAESPKPTATKVEKKAESKPEQKTEDKQ